MEDTAQLLPGESIELAPDPYGNTGFTGGMYDSPVPQGGAQREAVAMGQTSHQPPSPYSGLSSFFGMGPLGTYVEYDGGADAPAPKPQPQFSLLAVGVLAVAIYFIVKG